MWALREASVELIDEDGRPPLAAVSPQVSIGASGQPTTWSLFESRVVRAAVTAPKNVGGPKQKRQRVADSGSGSDLDVVEMLLYTGGLAWKCEFCPFLTQSHGSGSTSGTQGEVLATSVHPMGNSANKVGALLEGPGAVQLWMMGGSLGPHAPPPVAATSDNDELMQEMSSSARMVYCLTHSGRVTWDLKWCPQAPPSLLPSTTPPTSAHLHSTSTHNSTSRSNAPLPILGLLAMVLGDGTVEITPVPQPHAVLKLQHDRQSSTPTIHKNQPTQDIASEGQTAATSSQPQASQDAPQEAQPSASTSDQDPNVQCRNQEAEELPGLMIRVQPTVVLRKEQLGGCSPSTCEWQAGSSSGGGPCRLLVGCWDGSVLGLRMPVTSLVRLQVLFHIMCDAVSIRRLLCAPQLSDWETDNDHVFWATGSSGRLKKWDTREPSSTVHEQLLHRCTVLDIAWADNPSGMIAACEDGCLRHVMYDFSAATNYKDSHMNFIKGDLQGCVWSVDFSQAALALAYCGDDGLVGLWPWGHVTERRQRKPHAAMGGWAREGRGLRLLGPEDVVASPHVSAGGRLTGSSGTIIGGTVANGNVGVEGGEPEDIAASALEDDVKVLHCVRFSPHVVNGCVWLVSGGKAGFLRCQRLRLPLLV